MNEDEKQKDIEDMLQEAIKRNRKKRFEAFILITDDGGDTIEARTGGTLADIVVLNNKFSENLYYDVKRRVSEPLKNALKRTGDE